MMQQQKVHSKGLSDKGLGGFVKERMYTPSRKINALNHQVPASPASTAALLLHAAAALPNSLKPASLSP
jgi:hypothetical protein